jgi:hypothetical protein
MNLTTLPKGMAKWTMMSWPRLPIPFSMDNIPFHNVNLCCDFKEYLSNKRGTSLWCGARRQVRYQDEDEDGDDEYGHNEEISKLEFYSQSARGEALIVHALVDQNEVEVLIFKVSCQKVYANNFFCDVLFEHQNTNILYNIVFVCDLFTRLFYFLSCTTYQHFKNSYKN